MTTPATFARIPSRFQRGCALLAVALLLLLTVSAVSPTLHAWLHPDGDHEANHQCAVVLFASGVALTPATVLAAPDLAWSEQRPATAPALFLIAARYLRQPERGPPAC
jgi:hypothetical protein